MDVLSFYITDYITIKSQCLKRLFMAISLVFVWLFEQ